MRRLRHVRMYSPHDHGTMIADGVRVGAYRRALQSCIKPGDVVVDLGSGSGLFAIFAVQFGACKVYAIECEEVIDLARQIAKDNGCQDRIEFIRDLSTDIELPEKANVVVSDIHGGLPFFGNSLETILDARRRFLAPGGTMIPLRERVWTAPANLPAEDYDRASIWTDRRWAVDLSAGSRFGADHVFSAALGPERFAADPACITTVEHMLYESPSVGGETAFQVSNDTEANGYLLWFESDLVEGISVSSAPGQPKTVYPNLFAPWPRPISLSVGDVVETEFCFNLVHDDYVWNWNTKVRGKDRGIKAEFRQSSFNSRYITSEELRRRAPFHRPKLNSVGMGEQVLLQLMNGERTLGEVAALAFQQCPEAFRDEKAALMAAAKLSEKFSR